MKASPRRCWRTKRQGIIVFQLHFDPSILWLVMLGQELCKSRCCLAIQPTIAGARGRPETVGGRRHWFFSICILCAWGGCEHHCCNTRRRRRAREKESREGKRGRQETTYRGKPRQYVLSPAHFWKQGKFPSQQELVDQNQEINTDVTLIYIPYSNIANYPIRFLHRKLFYLDLLPQDPVQDSKALNNHVSRLL